MILLKEQFNIEQAFLRGLSCSEIKAWYYLSIADGKIISAEALWKTIPEEIRSNRRTIQRAVITLLEKNLAEDTRLFEGRKLNAYKRGVYLISSPDGVYVGQSKNIKSRWNSHKNEVNLGIHRYFKNVQLDDLKFEIVCECEEDKLLVKELLVAQKLKSEGKTVLNEDNFTLL